MAKWSSRARAIGARREPSGSSIPNHVAVVSCLCPQKNAYDLVYRHGLDVDASGELLVMGSTTGNLWWSENGGDAWTSLAAHLPPIYSVRFAS